MGWNDLAMAAGPSCVLRDVPVEVHEIVSGAGVRGQLEPLDASAEPGDGDTVVNSPVPGPPNPHVAGFGDEQDVVA